jgi:bacillithiol biosynthesis cysteine-adding enzyme BshC
MYKLYQLPYHQTGVFSKIILDYLDQAEYLKQFFLHAPTIDGVKRAIEHRKKFSNNRTVLVKILEEQYAEIEASHEVKKNISALLSENTFTVCTAHQPNIFTGHLYFIYKILHIIKLAEHLNAHLPENNFVPVYYMGSEDADLEELGHIFINGQKYEWQTNQKGAVGRMKVDDAFLKLIEEISGQLDIFPDGNKLLHLVKKCYTKDLSIQEATFKLVNDLFSDYGLIVLIPDNAELKKLMSSIFEDDISRNTPSEIVSRTGEELSKYYKVQAYPREIYLFYLKDSLRYRIIEKSNVFYVEDTDIYFTLDEIKNELQSYPERFSPNVILRGLYQEIILPNLVFIGGGGELAYWLELKDLFIHYNIPYPVLLLRNSFLLIDKNATALCKKLQLDIVDLFKPENILINELVKKESTHQLYLTLEKQQIKEVYDEVKNAVQQIDDTLKPHTEALYVKALKGLDALEKKMLKAEKAKFETQQRQIKKLKSLLFPHGGLQERVENFMPYYSRYGKDFISILYENSLVFQQLFCVLSEEE